MKAISLKAVGRPQLPQILEGIKSVINRNRVTAAVIGAMVTYAGVLTDSEPAMFAGAFAALAAIRHLTAKGGDQ